MIAVEIDADSWPPDADWAKRAEEAALAAVGASPLRSLIASPLRAEISVLLTDDDAVRRLNRDYRDKDAPTNVLSFPMTTRDLLDAAARGQEAGELLLGDIALARGVCEREAADKGIAVTAHAAHLIVHGTYHLLGFDHQDDAAAEAMEAAERIALASLGIADPYTA